VLTADHSQIDKMAISLMAGCVSSMSRPLVAPMSYPMSSTPSPMASLGRSRANNGTARRLVKANISIQERQSLSGRCVRAAERRGATRHTRRVAASSAKQDVEQVAGSDAEELDWANAIKFFIFPALGGLLFGYDIGATSGALVSLKSAATSGTDWGPALTPLASGAVVSSSLAGALLGSTITLILGDKLGRKQEILLAAALYGGSATLMAATPNLALLILGHTAYGTGVGLAMHAAPAYIAETVPPQVRGLFISLKECLIVTGILLGYLSSNIFIDEASGWRFMYGSAIPVAMLLAAGMASLPESPRWLSLSGSKSEEAASALRMTLGKAATQQRVDDELKAMERKAVKEDPSGKDEARKFTEIFTKSSYRQPLLVGTSLMLFQQITGQPSVLYYAAQIFQDAGFSAASDATRVSVILGAFKLLITGVACAKVDSWGRRPLLLAGISGIVASLVVLSGSTQGLLGDSSALTSVGALLIYVGCYQLSFGPISWLIVGEVFPLAVRGQALAIATIINFGSNFGVSLVLPYAQDTFGLSSLYLAFAVIGLGALAVVYASVPETRGKTLEEIEAFWGGNDDNNSP